MQRRCGWVAEAQATPSRVVWARAGVAVSQCPKSLLTAESLGWIEEFHAWKRLGWPGPERLGARQAEAFMVLEQELAAEAEHAG